MIIDLSLIGDILNKRRQELGLTIGEVAGNLNLRKVMVESIECGDEKFLPHEVYVKGYIKEYARLLGVVEEILPYLNVAYTIIPTAEPDTEALGKMRTRLISKLVRTKIPPQAIVYSAVFVLILLIFFLVGTREERQVRGPALENATHVGTSGKEQETGTVAEMTSQKKLVIACHERTWVSVVIDGIEKKEFMMSPEEIIVLNGKERFDLLVGNAGGVKVFLNGKDTGFSGDIREVKRVTVS